jgi:hypothetical protein
VGRVEDILEGILGKSERAIDELPTQDNQKNSFSISKGQLIMRVDLSSILGNVKTWRKPFLVFVTYTRFPF